VPEAVPLGAPGVAVGRRLRDCVADTVRVAAEVGVRVPVRLA